MLAAQSFILRSERLIKTLLPFDYARNAAVRGTRSYEFSSYPEERWLLQRLVIFPISYL